MPQFEIHYQTVVYTDGRLGAVMLTDERWYPFRYVDDSIEMDINDDDGFIKPSTAYKMAELMFT